MRRLPQKDVECFNLRDRMLVLTCASKVALSGGTSIRGKAAACSASPTPAVQREEKLIAIASTRTPVSTRLGGGLELIGLTFDNFKVL